MKTTTLFIATAIINFFIKIFFFNYDVASAFGAELIFLLMFAIFYKTGFFDNQKKGDK